MKIRKPYLLFVGDVDQHLNAKTAFGLRDWLPELCIGQLRIGESAIDLGLPDMTPKEALSAGARTLVVATSAPGGSLNDSWRTYLESSIRAGLDIASGLHTRLNNDRNLAKLAMSFGRKIFDVRYNSQEIRIGTGKRRAGKRLLTVGGDCASGKKYTALMIARALRAKGYSADFRASGQTGVLIAGRGIVLDTVAADFVAGAAEMLSPPNDPGHWDVIEGQGSLLHPAYAAVSLGLLHGSQPDALVVCHDPLRKTLHGFPNVPYSGLDKVITTYLAAGRLTNPKVRLVGIAINTSKLTAAGAQRILKETARAHNVPCVDPLRTGVDEIVAVL